MTDYVDAGLAIDLSGLSAVPGAAPPVARNVTYERTAWMPEPCRGCERRELDFGGCRCQAFQLTGDAARTDPVCYLSP